MAGDTFFAGAFGSSLRLTGITVEIGGSVVSDADVELAGDSIGEAPWFEGFFSGSVFSPPVAEGLTVTDTAHIGGKLS